MADGDCIEIYRIGRDPIQFGWRRKDKHGKITNKPDLAFDNISHAVRSAESMNKDIPRKHFKVQRGLRLS